MVLSTVPLVKTKTIRGLQGLTRPGLGWISGLASYCPPPSSAAVSLASLLLPGHARDAPSLRPSRCALCLKTSPWLTVASHLCAKRHIFTRAFRPSPALPVPPLFTFPECLSHLSVCIYIVLLGSLHYDTRDRKAGFLSALLITTSSIWNSMAAADLVQEQGPAGVPVE